METLEPIPVHREPRGLLGSFDQLLTEPHALLERARVGKVSLAPLLAGGVLCAALYGAAAGFFQGDWQILVAALKAPLILGLTLLLCLPSLYVLSSLAGARWTGRSAVGARSGTVIWLVLFAVVSCQVATFLRPVLWRERGEALFQLEKKMFFLDHFGNSFDRPPIDARPEEKPAGKR